MRRGGEELLDLAGHLRLVPADAVDLHGRQAEQRRFGAGEESREPQKQDQHERFDHDDAAHS